MATQTSFFKQGMDTFTQCFKAPAVELFTQHLQSHPKHFLSWLYRGISYGILEQPEKAIADYTQAEFYGKGSEKLVAKGHKLKAQMKPKEATTVFKQATEEYPREPIGWHTYGADRYGNGLVDKETLTALQQAIELNYQLVGITHYILGMVLASQTKTALAIDHFQAARKLFPTCTIAYIALGDSLLQTGSTSEAEESYLQALDLNDTQIQTNLGLCRIYLRKGDYEAASLQAAVYIEAAYPTPGLNWEASRQGINTSSTNTTGTGVSRRTGGGKRNTGGGGSGGSDGGNGSGSDDDEDPLQRRYDNWQKVKKVAIEKGKYRDTLFYLTTIEDEYKWVSYDKASHAGSGFKVWINKGATLEFDSSYDENLKRMDGKHESNAGKVIRKSDMEIKKLNPKK